MSVAAAWSVQYAVAEMDDVKLCRFQRVAGGRVVCTLDAAAKAAVPGSGKHGEPDALVGKKAIGMGRSRWAYAPRFPVEGRVAAGAVEGPPPLPLVLGVPLGRLIGVELALFGGAMLEGEGSICVFLVVGSSEDLDPALFIAAAMSALQLVTSPSIIGSIC